MKIPYGVPGYWSFDSENIDSESGFLGALEPGERFQLKSLDNRIFPDINELYNDNKRKMFGETFDGIYACLDDFQSAETRYAKFSQQTINYKSIYISKRPIDFTKSINKVIYEVPELQVWTGGNGLHVKHEINNQNICTGISLLANEKTKKRTKIIDSDLQVSLENSFDFSSTGHKVEATSKYLIIIEYDSPKNVNEVKQDIIDVNQLLTFLSGIYITSSHFQFYDTNNESLDFFAESPKVLVMPKPFDILIPFDKSMDNLNNLYKKWISRDSDLIRCCNFLISAQHNIDGTYIDAKFAVLIQAVESLQRINADDLIEEELKQANEKRSEILSSLTNAQAKWLDKNFTVFISSRRYLRYLYTCIGKTAKYIYPEKEHFFDDYLTFRNATAHGKALINAGNIKKFLAIVNTLPIYCTAGVLVNLGLSQNDVFKLLEQYLQRSQQVHKSHKIYSKQ